MPPPPPSSSRRGQRPAQMLRQHCDFLVRISPGRQHLLPQLSVAAGIVLSIGRAASSSWGRRPRRAIVMAPLADTAIVKYAPGQFAGNRRVGCPAWGLNPDWLSHSSATTSGQPRAGCRGLDPRPIAQTPERLPLVCDHRRIARFDGVSFTVFSGANTPILGEGLISAMWAAPDGSLWIGIVHNGLLRFRNGRFESFEGNLGCPATLSVPCGRIRAACSGSEPTRASRGSRHGRATTVFAGGWEANVHVLLSTRRNRLVGANNGLQPLRRRRERVFTTKDGCWTILPFCSRAMASCSGRRRSPV